MGLLGKSKQAKENGAEIARLRQQLESRNTHLNAAKERIESLEKQRTPSNLEYQKLQRECQMLHDRHNQLEFESTIERSRNEEIVNRLKADVSRLTAENESCQGANWDLSQQMAAVLQRAEQGTFEIRQRNEELQTLKQQLARVEVGEKCTVGVGATDQDMASIFKSQLEMAESDNQKVVDGLRQEQLRAETELQRVQVTLHTREIRRRADAEAVEKHIEALKTEVCILQAQVKSLKKQHGHVEGQKVELEAKLKQADNLLQTRISEMTRRWRAFDEQEQRSKALLEEEREAARQTVSRLRNEVSSLTRDTDERTRQATEAEAKLKEMEDQFTTTRGTLNQVRNQLGNETRKALRAIEDGKVKDKKIELLQKQCVKMHLKLQSN